MTAPNSNPFRRSPWLYPFLACFLLFILFSAKQINDFDLGFHLRTGQWILVNHAIPQKDLYTYTVPQHDYVDMEWLYEVGLFCAYKWFGYPALTVLNIVLVFLAFGLVFARMKVGGAAPWLYPFLGLWTLVAVEPRFIVRPEVLTWVLLALQLYLLDLWWKGKKDLLFLLPLIQLLWVNTEGIFILGWVVMGAYLAGGWK
ncbi:MAG TPA: hypothetical protein VJ873_06580, partial [bacterium]|nr:hypothetical protein [bacterium]